jgi:predicted acyltransferase
MSLDALRGADMLFIMGFSGALVALCQLLGFGRDCWLSTQMTHVAWHGFRHHDTIFPLFLFLAGVAWPYSYASQKAKGYTTGRVLRKIALRVFLLFLLGLVGSNLFAFNYEKFRYDSVLAHIGICWAGAAVLFMFVKSFCLRLAVAALLLFGHWLVLMLFSAPDAAALVSSTDPVIAKKVASYAAYGTDNFSFTGNIAGWIDRVVMPGRLHEAGIFDPDGLLGKLTGIVTATFGVFAGELLRKPGVSGGRKTLLLLAAGLATLVLCLVCKPWCPVNKKIWTSTFVLAAGSYSFFMLAIFYWIVDVRKWRSWTFFFRVIGMNSITIYIMMRFVGFYGMSKFFFSGIAGLGNAYWSSLVLYLGQILIEWFVLLYFYRKKTFLKV